MVFIPFISFSNQNVSGIFLDFTLSYLGPALDQGCFCWFRGAHYILLMCSCRLVPQIQPSFGTAKVAMSTLELCHWTIRHGHGFFVIDRSSTAFSRPAFRMRGCHALVLTSSVTSSVTQGHTRHSSHVVRFDSKLIAFGPGWVLHRLGSPTTYSNQQSQSSRRLIMEVGVGCPVVTSTHWMGRATPPRLVTPGL